MRRLRSMGDRMAKQAHPLPATLGKRVERKSRSLGPERMILARWGAADATDCRLARKLGLEQYEAAFCENAIDEKVLPRLTAQDLKDLGVVIVGHRRTILEAIATLRTDASATAPASSLSRSKRQDTAERRQVTVMFSDLVGSTALSARMDPEDLREVISAYQKSVAETVRRFDGYVAKYMGDGVLIYFGYPQAHEDDAERAVRAGWELVAAVSGLRHSAASNSRRHRHGACRRGRSDRVRRGTGTWHRRRNAEPCRAIARRRRAEHGGHCREYAEARRQSVRASGSWREGPQGLSGPVTGLGCSTDDHRWKAASRLFTPSDLTDLVGREEELEVLVRRWSKAKGGEGQVVLLSGEAGIGKSRLTAALLERLATEAHTRLRYFCSPQHTDSALYPVISQMERAAGFTHYDSPQTKLDKLDAAVWRELSRPHRTRHCLPKCCPCRTMAATRHSIFPRSNFAKNIGSSFSTAGWTVTYQTRPNDFRGRALDRPNEP